METNIRFENMTNFSPDMGAGGGAGSKEDEVSKKNQKIVDLNIVLAKVPHEVREDTDKYVEYRKNVDEARERLKNEGIDVDAYTKKDLEIGTEEGNKVYGQRKGELRAIVEKVAKGEEPSEEEKKILEAVNIKQENLQSNERQEAPKETNNPWDRAISIIEMQKDPAVRRSMRVAWVQNHLEDMEIPYYVIQAQSEKIDNDSAIFENKEKIEEINKEKSIRKNIINEEDWNEIVAKCFDSVFGEEKKPTKQSIINESIWGFNGFFAVDLNKPKDTLVEGEVEKCNQDIEKMRLNEWIGIRRVLDNWTAIKNMDDIRPSSLSKDLFIGQKSEVALANTVCDLPGNVEGTVEKNVNLGLAIGKAMKSIRLHFEQNVNDDYWASVGADMKLREQLYSLLRDDNGNEINKYVGEAAFAFLVSNQMLTDLSKDDNFSKLVRQDKSKVKKYTNGSAADATVRRLVYENLREGGSVFKDPSLKNNDMVAITEILEKVLPTQLVPTGMSGGGSEALKESEEGWLIWRAQHQYTKVSVIDDRTKRKIEIDAIPLNNQEEQKKAIENLTKVGKANDPDSRLDMMKTALDVILTMKEVEDSKSDLSKLTDLNKKLITHLNGSLSDFNWLGSELEFNSDKNKFEDKQYIYNEFRYRDGSEKMSLNDWKSRFMLTMEQTYLYAHTAVDHLNEKPWDMFEFSKNVNELFSIEPQSERTNYVGHEKNTRRQHRTILLNYAEKIWDDVETIFKSIKPKFGILGNDNTARYPKWWSSDVSISNDKKSAIITVGSALGNWVSISNRLRKNISV